MKSDSDLIGDMRDPFYQFWADYRERQSDLGVVADITDCRTAFIAGWEAMQVVARTRISSDLLQIANECRNDAEQWNRETRDYIDKLTGATK